MNSLRYIILALFGLLVLEASAGTKYTVDNSGTDVENGESLADEWYSLDNGDTLDIPTGTYIIAEELYLYLKNSTTVVVMGRGMDSTIIDCDAFYDVYIEASNVDFHDLTIKNAVVFGGITIVEDRRRKSATVNLYSVKIENCSNDVDGGGVYYGDNTYVNEIDGCVFSSNEAIDGEGGGLFLYEVASNLTISNCIFENNEAGTSGGGLYVDYIGDNLSIVDCVFDGNISTSFAGGLAIAELASTFVLERNIFRNNQSDLDDSGDGYGAAFSMDEVDDDFDIINNIIYNNSGGYAIWLDENSSGGYHNVEVKNNTVALNDDGGIKFQSSFNTYSGAFAFNVVADNGIQDMFATFPMTFSGTYNVVESKNDNLTLSSLTNAYSFDKTLFAILDGNLIRNDAGFEYTLAKVPSGYASDDINGDTRYAPADIGAVENQLDTVAVWASTSSHTWTTASNWKRSKNPSSPTYKKIFIPECTPSNYPKITSTVNLSSADLYLNKGGIFHNDGTLTLNSMTVRSDSTGTGQFLDEGTLTCSTQLYEQYLIPSQWNFLGMPKTMTAADLLPGAVGTAYWLAKYDSQGRADNGMVEGSGGRWTPINSGATSLGANKGYIVWVDDPTTVEFDSAPSADVSVEIDSARGSSGPNDWGWNLVGNPYSIALSSDDVLANVDNIANTTSVVYINVGDGDQQDYESRPGGGGGDAEFIPAHQAYFVQANATANFKMQTAYSVFRNDVVFKSASVDQSSMLIVSVVDSVERDRAFIRLKDGCTDAYDDYWDSYKLTARNAPFLGIRSTLQGIDFDVNSFSITSETSKVVPLYLTVPDSLEELMFSFDVEGYEGKYLYLRDQRDGSLTEISHDMTYLVSLPSGVSPASLKNKFSIEIYNNDVVTAVNEKQNEEKQFHIYGTINGIHVRSSNTTDPWSVRIYDLLGKEVAQMQHNGAEAYLPTKSRGMYVVVVTQKARVESHKVLVP